jgi:hypothetical protein
MPHTTTNKSCATSQQASEFLAAQVTQKRTQIFWAINAEIGFLRSKAKE